jgi:hypothetical protein
VSCKGGDMSRKELLSLIEIKLIKGSSNKEIIAFFDKQNWVYDFDRHSHRYQARVLSEDDSPTAFGRHQIYIYVDKNKDFVKAEVIKMFNGI